MTQARLVTFDKAILISQQGIRRGIRGSVAPVVDDGGIVLGAVLVFHEIAPGGDRLQRQNEREEGLRKMIENGWGPRKASSIFVHGASASQAGPARGTPWPHSLRRARRSNSTAGCARNVWTAAFLATIITSSRCGKAGDSRLNISHPWRIRITMSRHTLMTKYTNSPGRCLKWPLFPPRPCANFSEDFKNAQE